jgi:hypothetical protein
MALKKMGNYNNIPAEYMPKLPKRGTVVTYRFLNYHYDPFGEDLAPIFQAKLMLPSFSKFFDENASEWIEIGLLDGVDSYGNPMPNKIRRVWTEPGANGGYLNLTIGNSQDDELFQYLELCSFNKSNKLRDTETALILERVDFEAEAKEARNELKSKMEAIKRAALISKEDLPKVASLLGYKYELGEEQVRFEIESFAHEYPEDFMDRMEDKLFDIKASVSLAIDEDLVYIDVEERKLKWSDSKGDIMRLVDLEIEEVIEAYAVWASKEKSGKDVHAELLSMLSKHKLKLKK